MSWSDRLKALRQSLIFRSIAGTFLARVGVLGLGFIATVLVARLLGPEGRGLYAVAATVAAIGVQLGNLGLHSANTYTVARDAKTLPALLGNSLLVSFLLGGGEAAAVWCIFSLWPDLSPLRSTSLLGIALLWLPLGLAVLLMQQLLIGLERFRILNMSEVGNAAAALVLILVLAWLHRVSVVSVFAAGFIALCVVFLGLLAYLFRLSDGQLTGSWLLFRKNLGYGLKAYAASLAAFLVIRIDLLMVQYMLGPQQTGYYSVATQLANTAFMLPVVVGTVLFPRLASLSDNAERLAVARRFAVNLTGAMVCISVVGWVLAGWAIPLVFGEAFRPSVVPFDCLLIAVTLLAANTVFMNYFAATGLPWIAVAAPLVGLFTNVAANLVVIPRWGIIGAAWTSVLGYGLMLLMSLAYIRHGLNRRLAG